jgi:hypothetical protein
MNNHGLRGLLFAILIAASGTVEVQKNNVWTAIAPGAQINDGERVRTGAGSSAMLDLGAGTMITLSQSSEIQVRQMQDPNVRTYTADARSFYQGEQAAGYPTYYLSPYLCTNPANGSAVPPVPSPAPPKR